MQRKNLVRNQKDLMTYYIDANKAGDVKKKRDVQEHINLNNQRFRALGPKR